MYYTSTWIGIDGFAFNKVGSQDVLQAGVRCTIAGMTTGSLLDGKIVHYELYAYWNWYSGSDTPDIPIPELPISVGDLLTCNISANSKTSALIILRNESKKKSISINASTSRTSLSGNRAEWIVECPLMDGKNTYLANYGSVTFNNCYATDNKGRIFQVGNGNNILMTDDDHPIIIDHPMIISSATIIQPNTVRCVYTGIGSRS